MALPKIVSIKPIMTAILQKTLKEKGDVDFENVSLSWFGPQKIDKLKLVGKEAEIYVDSFSTSSLLKVNWN